MTCEMPGILTILQGWVAPGAVGAQQVPSVRVLGVTTVYAPNALTLVGQQTGYPILNLEFVSTPEAPA